MHFSDAAPFGMLDFSSDASEGEKIYDAMAAAYMDPREGKPSIDLSVDEENYFEAKLYATAMAIAAARVTLKRAHAQLRPETSYELLEAHEHAYDTRPAAGDTITQRRAAVTAKKKVGRGPRYEAMVELLSALLGENFVAYRPMTTSEAETWPTSPGNGPGLWPRPDVPAKLVRFLDAVARVGTQPFVCDAFSEATTNNTLPVGDVFDGIGQSFVGDGRTLNGAQFYLRKNGSPTGNAVAKIYASTLMGGFRVPTGTALATSANLDVSTLTTSNAWKRLAFTGVNKIALTAGTIYVLTLEYAGGSSGNDLKFPIDTIALAHSGDGSFLTGSWNPDVMDVPFVVHTEGPYAAEVGYENLLSQDSSSQLVPGDVVAVDIGNLGLAERVTVTESRIDGTSRYLRAVFAKPHSAGVLAKTGPTPIWASTKRHSLIVVKSAAAVDARLVERVHAAMDLIARAPSTWAIVEPTTPGAATVGPFKIGTTLGSPLGAVPIEQITV